MAQPIILIHPVGRTTETVLRCLQTTLMVLGLFFILACAYLLVGKPDFFRYLHPQELVKNAEETEDSFNSQDAVAGVKINPRLQAALEYSARRYRVSPQVLVPIFEAADHNAQKLGLDPLLIVSVIAVESNFNPFSESNMGAQGLMQVIPRFHKEKFPPDAGDLPLFDPAINIAVGSQVLHEYIRRQGGSVPAGLQQFNGAINDQGQSYANKVLAIKERMESAYRRNTGTA